MREPLGKIISVKRNHKSNLVSFFSNSDFPPFFRATLFWGKLLLHTFSEYLLRHNSYFFGTAIFLEQLHFSPFSEQSLFCRSYFFRIAFFRSETSTEQTLFQNKKFFTEITFRNSYFIRRSCLG